MTFSLQLFEQLDRSAAQTFSSEQPCPKGWRLRGKLISLRHERTINVEAYRHSASFILGYNVGLRASRSAISRRGRVASVSDIFSIFLFRQQFMNFNL